MLHGQPSSNVLNLASCIVTASFITVFSHPSVLWTTVALLEMPPRADRKSGVLSAIPILSPDALHWYLTGFNLFCLLGWGYVLSVALLACLLPSSTSFYDSVGVSLRYFETFAVFEVVHVLIGIVPSSLTANIIQVGGRNAALWLVVVQSPPAQSSAFLVAMVLAWASADVIRFGLYAATQLGLPAATTRSLTWLRYNAFLVLYPVGVIGEAGCVAVSVAYFAAHGVLDVPLPNAHNIAFSGAALLAIILPLYPAIFWQLFSHMLRQRAKQARRK